MPKFSALCRLFSVFFLLIPALLWADPPLVEPAANTLTVESSANTATAQVLVSLTQIVVTANRLNTPANQVPNSMTVITAQDIEKKQAGTVNQALQEVPGLNLVQNGGPGQITYTYMRGAGDGAAQVMIDGIPLNDPESTGARSYDYLDELTLGGVQQIEVVRGPQSVLYGSNAMAGVINIVTQQGAGAVGGSVLFEGGSYGTVRESASVQGGSGTSDYALSTSYFDTAGFPTADKAFGNTVNNPDTDFSSLLKLGAQPVSNLREEVLVDYNQSRTNFDDGAGSSTTPTPIMDDPNQWADQKQVLVGSKTRLTLGDWGQSLILSFGDNNRYYSDSQNSAYPNSFTYVNPYDGQTAQATWQNDLKVAPGKTLVFGLQGYQEWGSTSYSSGAPGTLTQASQWSESGFLEAQVNQDDRFFLNLGGRVDNTNVYGAHGTYQAGAAYFIPGLETKLKATYGTGFSAPSLFELYDPTHGNTALQPETNTSYDFGFEQPLWGNQIRFGATYFHDDFENLISYYGPQSTGQYMNSSSFQTEGVETFLEVRYLNVLTLKGFYTYTNVETEIPASFFYSPLIGKLTNQAGLDVDYQSGPLEAGVSASYAGARPSYDFDADFFAGAPVTLAEYYLVNLRASVQVDEHVKLYARVDNLFNQFYEDVYGYGTPGLSGYAGTKVSF